MSFRPNAHDELIIDGVAYRIAEHPAAPGIPYGQEGRAGIVYSVTPRHRSAGFQPAALKVFRARFRTPALVSQAEKLAAFADLPGLTVCRRTVLTRAQNADLLRQHPDLIYAVLMPWIEGPTWVEVMLEKRPLTPQQALDLARAFAEVLESMEVHGLAHCDLSGPNVLLPMLADRRQTADRRPPTAHRPPSNWWTWRASTPPACRARRPCPAAPPATPTAPPARACGVPPPTASPGRCCWPKCSAGAMRACARPATARPTSTRLRCPQ
jgi:hypothetical protein